MSPYAYFGLDKLYFRDVVWIKHEQGVHILGGMRVFFMSYISFRLFGMLNLLSRVALGRGGCSRTRELLSLIAKIMLAALSYFYAAKLGLTLAIPPGYAAAVWPAAGIALAVVLKWGNKLWPGIVIGSFLANYNAAFVFDWSFFNAENALLPVLLGAGAALQAVVGRQLVRLFLNGRFTLLKVQEVLKFIFLVALLSGAVNSSLGVFNLYQFNLISIDEIFVTWINWWVGDSIGMIFVVPLVYALHGRSRASWGARRIAVSVPLVISLIIVSISLYQIRINTELKIAKEFSDHASVPLEDIERRWGRYVENIRSAGSFVEVYLQGESQYISSRSFGGFVKYILEEYSGIRAISWNPLVSNENRASFELLISHDNYEISQITERDILGRLVASEERDWYVPVHLIEPLERNTGAVGFDIMSNQIRREAVEISIENRAPAATRLISLVQDDSSQNGMLIVFPVFSDRSSLSVFDAIIGFVVGVFVVDDVLLDSNVRYLADTKVEIFDITEPSESVLISRFCVASDREIDVHCSDSDGLINDQYKTETTFNVANRTWVASIFPTDTYLKNFSISYEVFLIESMLAISVALIIILLSVTGDSLLQRRYQNHILRVNERLNREVVRRENAERELKLQANTDSLTGVSNRRVFDETIIHLIELSKRYRSVFSLLLIDVDHFKNINDSFGHDVGDQVLIALSRKISKIIRASDTLCRFGGEEFAVLLPNTASNDAFKTAEKIRKIVDDEAFQIGGKPIAISISVGVSQFGYHVADKRSLIEATDHALYEAKQNGRNQVVVSNR